MESSQPVTLLERVREAIRYKHYSIRTERAYVEWVRRFVLFHGRRHPRDMGADEVRAFLGHLAGELKVAASTHHQALSALLFLYREVLGVELPWLDDLLRPKKPQRRPVVLSHGEVERLLAVLEGTHALMARLIYGSGMRLMECVRLRVKDMDFERGELLVRDGKGATDPAKTGEPELGNGACSLVAKNYEDQIVPFVDGVCFKILRKWTVIDWCKFGPNTDVNGVPYPTVPVLGTNMWTFTQTIAVSEKEAPEIQKCSKEDTETFADNCAAHVVLTNTANDCTPAAQLKWTYTIDTNNDGVAPFINGSGSDASGQFPVGTHKITWIVEDMCGIFSTCFYTFNVVDRKKPSPYCISELTTVIMPNTGQVEIWAKDFDKGSSDNCPLSTCGLKFTFNGFRPPVTNTERFGDVFPGSCLERLFHAAWISLGGNDDHRDVRKPGIVVQEFTPFETCETRHHQVERDQVRLEGISHFHGFGAVVYRNGSMPRGE